MTANDKDNRILEMLKNGKSYSDIIAELSVSPSRIVVVKKRNPNFTSSTNDALLGTTITKIQEPKKEVVAADPEVVLRKTIPSPPPAPLQPLPPKKEVAEVGVSNMVMVKFSDIKSVQKPQNDSSSIHEAGIIKKYLSMNRKSFYKADYTLFLNEIQKLIKEGKITKSSKYANEIMHIQENLVRIINANLKTRGIIFFTLDSSDKLIKTAAGTL